MTRAIVIRKTDVRPVLRVMVAVVGLVLPVGALAAGRVAAIEQDYALGKLQAAGLALERENQALTLEVSTLRAPARLERLGRDKLHMAVPGSGDVLLEGGGTSAAVLLRAVARGESPTVADQSEASWGARR